MLASYTNTNGDACIYANSGTWIDKKVKSGETADQDVQNMDFIVIAPQAADNSMIKVERFQYQKGAHISMESKSIKL